jgi:hypothetical protein
MSKYVLASIGPASYEEIHTGTLDLRTARGRTKGAMMDQEITIKVDGTQHRLAVDTRTSTRWGPKG